MEARYPGLTEPVTNEEYEEAIKLAEAMITWVEEKIKTAGLLRYKLRKKSRLYERKTDTAAQI